MEPVSSSATTPSRLAAWEVERALWYARWAAAAVAAVQGAVIEPLAVSRPYLIPATFGFALLLAGTNLALWPALRRREVSTRLAALVFGVDLAVVTGIVWLYLDNPDATQWVLYLILQLEAAYRWEMRGAVGTAAVASLLYSVARFNAAREFGFDVTVDSITYVLGLTVVQGLVVGGMAGRLRAERDATLQLHGSALALNAALDRHSILSTVAREAARLSRAAFAVVWTPATDGFAVSAAYRLPRSGADALVLPGTDPVFGRSTVGEAYATREPVVGATTSGPAVVEATVLPRGWRTVTSVPILHEGEPLGVLSCYQADRAEPGPADVGRLQALAALAAVAISNAAAYDRERSAVESMRSLDRLKDDFLSTVSHELRTPLTVVEGFATTLRSRWDDMPEAQRLDLVRRIEAQAQSLHERIGDLLEFSRLQTGELRLVPGPLQLAPVIVETVNRLEPTLSPHPVRVDVSEDLRCWADAMAVSQVVENLLVNAARYSPPEAPIDLVAGPAGAGEVEILVVDRGIGIPEQEQGQIFERFYRGQTDEVRRVRGTGVGLAIVASVVTALGGTVRVSSVPGEGSTFTITLPADQPSAETAEPDTTPADVTR